MRIALSSGAARTVEPAITATPGHAIANFRCASAFLTRMSQAMERDLYVRLSGEGISRLMSAEIIDEWEDGFMIRSEEVLPTGPGRTYYVEEGDHIVALDIPRPPQSEGPFDYAAQIDRSDVRPVSVLTS